MAGLHLSRQKWFALAAVVLATAAAVWFCYFRTDDTTAVKKRLREAVAFAEKQPKGSGINLQAAGAAHALGEFFAHFGAFFALGFEHAHLHQCVRGE